MSPCMVQGERAPDSIVEALYNLYAADVDVIILARGGGHLAKGDLVIERVVCAVDVGRAINPLSLAGQIEGGVEVQATPRISDNTAITCRVVANGILNLSPDKSAVVREIARVLKPGGRFVFAGEPTTVGNLLP